MTDPAKPQPTRPGRDFSPGIIYSKGSYYDRPCKASAYQTRQRFFPRQSIYSKGSYYDRPCKASAYQTRQRFFPRQSIYSKGSYYDRPWQRLTLPDQASQSH
ncbi:hypothetical protein JTE90_026710 [Oedothorax gibbosus]|uniref:Uncharacterized protein n=1 Tax=Oedothorax gibbosus TaxID=931172 RepID=A0AAV6V275_9ARAC|nr:hypothetical protein JTE90_026710 [Oedothorax gibbosus]